ncbi:MAG: hypothetical protein L0Z53_25485 [Acidobacteriales bacterium]|nr:hypothetical protein [Terriglobales bacterium]
MTIAAINAESGDVVLMAEGRVLYVGFVLPGDVRGALQLGKRAANGD